MQHRDLCVVCIAMSVGWKCLGLLVVMQGAATVAVEHTYEVAYFCQSENRKGSRNEVFDDDEMFHIDPDRKVDEPRLPEFEKWAWNDSSLIQGALANLGICENHLKGVMKAIPDEPAVKVPPKPAVFPEEPVELGWPNTLICALNDFTPPTAQLRWLKNGQPVTSDVSSTDYIPLSSNKFAMFSYLSFTPQEGDIYTCHVEHTALSEPVSVFWDAEVPTDSDASETAFCAIGLALGILGVVLGTVFLIKAIKFHS
uniref:RLA class II histocompatibility antigen, DP alpha-1 chain-like n=1 Tax=Lepisosteus oculatus TaxID=7918 RepID=W5MK71_LEPOC